MYLINLYLSIFVDSWHDVKIRTYTLGICTRSRQCAPFVKTKNARLTREKVDRKNIKLKKKKIIKYKEISHF